MKRARAKKVSVAGAVILEEEELDPAEFGVTGEAAEAAAPVKKPKRKALKGLTASELEAYNKAHAQRGVVYLSRIPPRLTPQRLQRTMSEFGKVSHMFLREESKEKRQRRKKECGMGGRRYTDGWVEFEDKDVARTVAASLNGAAIGGPRRCYFAQDLWVMKYLPGFTWDDLQEHLDRERENRHQRLQLAISRAKHENDAFLENVAASKRMRSREGARRMAQLHERLEREVQAEHKADAAHARKLEMIQQALATKKKKEKSGAQ